VPSLLIETAYISNPEEERRLDSHDFRRRIATAIFSGVRNYFYRNPPQGTLVAELTRGRSGGRAHVIRAGETLSAIASRYNISVRRIRDANGLRSDRVTVGQVLRIPMVRET
jgi:N-acetylmuramoyl-L-alanine amidase